MYILFTCAENATQLANSSSKLLQHAQTKTLISICLTSNLCCLYHVLSRAVPRQVKLFHLHCRLINSTWNNALNFSSVFFNSEFLASWEIFRWAVYMNRFIWSPVIIDNLNYSWKESYCITLLNNLVQQEFVKEGQHSPADDAEPCKCSIRQGFNTASTIFASHQ